MILARAVDGKTWWLLRFKRGREIMATKSSPAQAVALPAVMFSKETRKALRESRAKESNGR